MIPVDSFRCCLACVLLVMGALLLSTGAAYAQDAGAPSSQIGGPVKAPEQEAPAPEAPLCRSLSPPGGDPVLAMAEYPCPSCSCSPQPYLGCPKPPCNGIQVCVCRVGSGCTLACLCSGWAQAGRGAP
jgi:hypothetical protein